MGIEWDVAVFENGIMKYLQHAISRENDDKLLDFGEIWGCPIFRLTHMGVS